MTVDELLARESIRHTLARYNVFGDRMRVADLIGLFTEDGILELEGKTRGESVRHVGREGIARFFEAMRGEGASASEPPAKPPAASGPMFVRHHLTTCHIELTGADSADVRAYFTVYTPIGPDHCGVYVDKFRKTGEGWLIAHRQPRVDWTAPNTIFAKASK